MAAWFPEIRCGVDNVGSMVVVDMASSAYAATADWSWLPGAFVAVLALAFAVGSFWWLQARQGELHSYEPHSFAFAGSPQQMMLRFPLVLFNDGAKPIVVQDLRLSFPDEPGAVLPLPWRTSRSQLKPGGDDDRHQFPAVFAVPGRQTQQHFIEFGGPFPGLELSARDYQISIEVKLGHKDGWQPLLSFLLHAGHITGPDSYITYSNAPSDLTPKDVAKADASLRRLMEQLKAARASAAKGDQPQDGKDA